MYARVCVRSTRLSVYIVCKFFVKLSITIYNEKKEKEKEEFERKKKLLNINH